MLATLLDNGYLVLGIVAGSLTVGGAVGRGTRQALATRAAQRRDDRQIKQAVVGKPADEYGPREPGLIEMMANLRQEFDEHKRHA